VAGKTAQLTITMKKIEWPHLPEIDTEFAKSLGVEDGDTTKMRGENNFCAQQISRAGLRYDGAGHQQQAERRD